MLARVFLAAAALALAAPRPARACGPDFDVERLVHRTTSLLELPGERFLDAVTDLVPAPSYTTYYAPLEYQKPGDPLRDADTAIRAGGGTRERELYETAARDFDAGAMSDARDDFRELLALPAAERRQRTTWAAYMIARTYGTKDNLHAAIAAYQQVRALVADGWADELGLADSSLGQEARLQLLAGDDVAAVHLYAQQAAIDYEGALSLLVVARQVVSDPPRRAALLRDPVGQKLVASYLADRGGELDPAMAAAVWRDLQAIPNIAGADRLAPVAYDRGDWAAAARFAMVAPDARRSLWILAKLAARDGDLPTAELLLGRVAAACTEDRDVDVRAQLDSDRTIVALAADRTSDALAHAWDAADRSPADLAYVAERVVTIEELRAFVDAMPGPHAIPEEGDYGFTENEVTLRELLARRMMRAGRVSEALPYFSPAHALLARAYAVALAAGRDTSDDDPVARAGALLAAAQIARHDGLEILGTEHAPDWNLYSASYDPHGEYFVDPDDHQPADTHTALEDARVDASAPSRDHRYHYRYIASALAEQAAEMLPHRSQAFGAALCASAGYIYNVDPDRRGRLYRRAIHEGGGDGDFGHDCPAPDLEEARHYLPMTTTPDIGLGAILHILRRHPRALTLAAALALLAIAAAIARSTAYRR